MARRPICHGTARCNQLWTTEAAEAPADMIWARLESRDDNERADMYRAGGREGESLIVFICREEEGGLSGRGRLPAGRPPLNTDMFSQAHQSNCNWHVDGQ